MLTLSQIRQDLKDIRYYYDRKRMFDQAAKDVGTCAIVNTVNIYNEVIRNAPPKLYDLYVSLYINNKTQEALSIELSYTPEYIQMLNKRMLKYLQTNLI